MSNRQQAKIVSLPLFSPDGAAHAVAQAEAHAPAAVLAERAEPVDPADLDALRKRARTEHGRTYWRTLNELAETPDFAQVIAREFPHEAGEWHDPVSRRNFMKLMGAGLALAGVGLNIGCEQRDERIVPYVNPPENMIPGKPLFYASAFPMRSGQAIGVLVEQHMGRPTKVEGNPEHPASLGATDVTAQGSVLSMYDPDRSQVVMEAGAITTWSQFFRDMETRLYPGAKADANLRIRVLTETVCSPTLANQIRTLMKSFPQTRWHQYEPCGRDNVNMGGRAAFGPAVNTIYDFSKAERILSLDSNFLYDEPGSLVYARQFTDGRRVRASEEGGKRTLYRESATKLKSEMKRVDGGFEMNRLYVVESTPTITGAKADHRLALKPSQVYDFALAVARAVGASVGNAGGADRPPLPADAQKWVQAIADDLKSHTGKSIVIAGDHQPPAVHVLAHAMNAALQNAGQTVIYTDTVEPEQTADVGADGKGQASQIDSLKTLLADMQAGNVDILLMLGGNPVYTAPADLNFGGVLEQFVNAKAPDKSRFLHTAIHLSSHYDETSFKCHWHLPESHFLEAWGDLRSYDGTVSIQQPLIAPLYATRSAIEVLNGLLLVREGTGYEIVRAYWQQQDVMGGSKFEETWAKSLHDGLIAGTAFRPKQVTLKSDVASAVAPPKVQAKAGGVEVVFRPDPNIWDGRWANNGWLMELPRPLTKITWDNVILMSPSTAAKLGIKHKNIDDRHFPEYTIRRGNRDATGAVWINYGHPDDSITVHLGFGRTRAGRVGGLAEAMTESNTYGFDAYKIRTSDAMGLAADCDLGATGKGWEIACTQHHQLIDFSHLKNGGGIAPYQGENLNEQREIVKELNYDEYKTAPVEPEKAEPHVSFYPDYNYLDTNGLHKWAMVIDQTACIGCQACVIACQSENNIATVGKRQVIMQREMHWLRIDTYYTGDPVTPDMLFQPMLCQHCEQAPCETVCPVAATSHSDEGINEMTYNRCVGTRYCLNNCPYKVRRFNFLQYNENWVDSLKLMRNPDVTVRNRGVMEKCTYCIQRVTLTRIETKKLDVEAIALEDQGDKAGADRVHQKAADVLAGLQTACQQVCPTEAILFGDLHYQAKLKSWNVESDRMLTVTNLKEQPEGLHYDLLDAELNTRPRTTYLAIMRNFNPALPKPGDGLMDRDLPALS
jgi:molybdopterin-containing oxidoreductase family iron-sulfur binding subunit